MNEMQQAALRRYHEEQEEKRKKEQNLFPFLNGLGFVNEAGEESQKGAAGFLNAIFKFILGFFSLFNKDGLTNLGIGKKSVSLDTKLEARIPVELKGDLKRFRKSLPKKLQLQLNEKLKGALVIKDPKVREDNIYSVVACFYQDKVKDSDASTGCKSQGEQLYFKVQEKLKDLFDNTLPGHDAQRLNQAFNGEVQVDDIYAELALESNEKNALLPENDIKVLNPICRNFAAQVAKVLQEYDDADYLHKQLWKLNQSIDDTQAAIRALENNPQLTAEQQAEVKSLKVKEQALEEERKTLNAKAIRALGKYEQDKNTVVGYLNPGMPHRVDVQRSIQDAKAELQNDNKKQLKDCLDNMQNLIADIDLKIGDLNASKYAVGGVALTPEQQAYNATLDTMVARCNYLKGRIENERDKLTNQHAAPDVFGVVHNAGTQFINAHNADYIGKGTEDAIQASRRIVATSKQWFDELKSELKPEPAVAPAPRFPIGGR